MNNRKAISLISLIITILVIVIISAVIIPTGIDKINSTRLAVFNNDVISLKQEVIDYMLITNLKYPVITDASDNYIAYSIASNSTLLAEAVKKNDQKDVFYILDLNKLGIDNKDIGTGKTVDDYYIIAKESKNVYYAKGVQIGDKTYYAKRDKSDGVTEMIPTSAAIITTNTPIPTPTQTPTSTPTPTQTPTPTIAHTPSTITLSSVLFDGTSSGPIGSTLGGHKFHIKGNVQGSNNGEAIYLYYKSSIESTPNRLLVLSPGTGNLELTSNTTLQSFDGSTILEPFASYTITFWAENQYGDKSNEIVRNVIPAAS